MFSVDARMIQEAILTILNRDSGRPTYKYNLIGNQYQPGPLEGYLELTFSDSQRVAAVTAFDQLRLNGYIQPNFNSLHERENWVMITDAGRQFLKSGLRDNIDLCISHIGEHLVELRRGMHDAAVRNSPDAPRQAVHSARELIDQTLKEGAPKELTTRKERVRHLVQQNRALADVSKTDIEIIDACDRLIEAEHKKAKALSHARDLVSSDDARAIAEAAERMLRLIFRDAPR